MEMNTRSGKTISIFPQEVFSILSQHLFLSFIFARHHRLHEDMHADGQAELMRLRHSGKKNSGYKID